MFDPKQAQAATFVEPRGMIRSAVSSVGGLAGALAASPGDGPLTKGSIGYLGIYDDEIVLFSAKRGAFKPKATSSVIASASRTALNRAGFKKGRAASVLELAFTDGAVWAFEIPRVHLSGAQSIAAALGAA